MLDAAAAALDLHAGALASSRAVLREYGNMSSATILFVLKDLMLKGEQKMRGCGMAFGPGLTG